MKRPIAITDIFQNLTFLVTPFIKCRKPVKLGSCEVAPNVIKKTISHVNRDIIMQVSDKVYKKRGKIHSLPAYLKTAIFQQTCEYLMLPQNEFGFEGYAEMRDFCKTYLSI